MESAVPPSLTSRCTRVNISVCAARAVSRSPYVLCVMKKSRTKWSLGQVSGLKNNNTCASCVLYLSACAARAVSRSPYALCVTRRSRTKWPLGRVSVLISSFKKTTTKKLSIKQSCCSCVVRIITDILPGCYRGVFLHVSDP